MKAGTQLQRRYEQALSESRFSSTRLHGQLYSHGLFPLSSPSQVNASFTYSRDKPHALLDSRLFLDSALNAQQTPLKGLPSWSDRPKKKEDRKYEPAPQPPLRNKENLESTARKKVVEEQILGDYSGQQNGVQKRIVSTALTGQRLKRATQEELEEGARERLKYKNERMRERSEPALEEAKVSSKAAGVVQAYAANTNQGLVRNYNEDRVSIILNILKPESRKAESWPKCSFFGIYDGHGGTGCADYLRDNLHQFVIKQPSFPWNPKEALKNGFRAAEAGTVLTSVPRTGQLAQRQQRVLRPGRADRRLGLLHRQRGGQQGGALVAGGGKECTDLSRDHKPVDEAEQRRILSNGGKVFQTEVVAERMSMKGPLRVFPGKLSVSRTFGDQEAKLERLGGNSRVVVAEPEISSFEVSSHSDFIVMGCDGIFDRLESSELVDLGWRVDRRAGIHGAVGAAANLMMKEALLRKSADNVTILMIAFGNYSGAGGRRKEQAELCHSSEKLPLNKTLDSWREKGLEADPRKASIR